MNLHRIYWRLLAESGQAMHIYDQVGVRHEGHRRQAEFSYGLHRDMLWLSERRDEWAGCRT